MGWHNLGTVVPSFLEWRLFQDPSVNERRFRVTFLGDIANVNSHCLIRSYWANDEISKPIYLYPTPEKQIIEIPFPLSDDPIYMVRYFKIIKRWKRRRFNGYRTDSAWSVKLEEYTSTGN